MYCFYQVLISISIVLFFRAEFSASDIAVITALFLGHWATFLRVRWIVPISVTIYGPIVLLPMLFYLWVDRGTGNANYLFFPGFALCLAAATAISGFANATLRHRPKIANQEQKLDKME